MSKSRFVIEVDQEAAEALAYNAQSCKCSVEQFVASVVADNIMDERGTVHVKVDGRGWTISVDPWECDSRVEPDDAEKAVERGSSGNDGGAAS